MIEPKTVKSDVPVPPVLRMMPALSREVCPGAEPESEISLKSKSELALEMVRQARQNGVRFSWVGTDGGYGKEPSFLRRLQEQGEIFVSDVHKDQRIYVEDPAPFMPARPGERGKKPRCLKARVESQRADEWAQYLS